MAPRKGLAAGANDLAGVAAVWGEVVFVEDVVYELTAALSILIVTVRCCEREVLLVEDVGCGSEGPTRAPTSRAPAARAAGVVFLVVGTEGITGGHVVSRAGGGGSARLLAELTLLSLMGLASIFWVLVSSD